MFQQCDVQKHCNRKGTARLTRDRAGRKLGQHMLRSGLSFSWIHLLKFVLLGKLADGVVVFSLIVIRVIRHDLCACTVNRALAE
jgi:hypothetical protein